MDYWDIFPKKYECQSNIVKHGYTVEVLENLEKIHESMCFKNRTDIARKILESSPTRNNLVNLIVHKGKNALLGIYFLFYSMHFKMYILANDILRVSFDYRDFGAARQGSKKIGHFRNYFLENSGNSHKKL